MEFLARLVLRHRLLVVVGWLVLLVAGGVVARWAVRPWNEVLSP